MQHALFHNGQRSSVLRPSSSIAARRALRLPDILPARHKPLTALDPRPAFDVILQGMAAAGFAIDSSMSQVAQLERPIY